MQNMAAAITRLQATTDALGALGARLSIGEGDTVAPEILAALDEVLAAAGAPDVGSLESQQRTMMAGMRLRTIRDGGSVLDTDGAAELLRSAGCQDVHSLTRTWPIPVGYVVGQKA
jgi:hypothetical protein